MKSVRISAIFFLVSRNFWRKSAHVDLISASLENAVSRTELPLSREQITLFLERPYISGVGPALEQRVKQMFVELACRKADEMNVTPVLNVSYQDSCKTDFARTRYDIYISASKAGKQYLDSLDGEASVTK